MRYFLTACWLLLGFLLISCNSTNSNMPRRVGGHETKVYNWCTYLKQKEAISALDTYQSYPFIEADIRETFKGDLIDVERWYQGGFSGIDYIVEWQREEFFGILHYEVAINSKGPLWIHAYTSTYYPSIRLDDIVDCLGNPDYYAVNDYLFGYGGFNESADIVLLYYVEQDIEIQLFKPRDQNLREPLTEFHFAESYAFPDGDLAPQLNFRAPYPSIESLRVWVP